MTLAHINFRERCIWDMPAMKLYIYKGLNNERVPRDVTHVIVDRSVTTIKMNAFTWCEHLVSIIMRDNVKRIEHAAFRDCVALRYIRLSKTLEYIGRLAFWNCESMEALFLPSTVKEIARLAFRNCQSLRLVILPNDIDLTNVYPKIIVSAAIEQIAETAGVNYLEEWGNVTKESDYRVTKWLIHHMADEAPFHKLCYNTSVTVNEINTYINENGKNSALAIDPFHSMTPLHMLSMNPHAPADAIAALLAMNTEALFCEDNQGKTSLDYAKEYNVSGLLGMVNVLCNHRRTASSE